MVSLIGRSLSLKVALLVNTVLILVMAAGSLFMIQRQGNSLEQQLLERGQLYSMLGAESTSTLFEEAIDNGVLTLKEVLDTDYQEIPGFDPPKFHTKYDFYTDKALLSIEDEFLNDTSVVFAAAVDKQGYLPTHNTKYQKPLTGNPEVDLVANRTKRIFDDSVGLAAAVNTKPGFQQVYYRDTGEIMWDISSPVYVKGKHWGGFRIGFSLDAVNAAKADLAYSLAAIMLAILLISIICSVLIINMKLKPLRRFTQKAAAFADGRVEDKIVSTSKDEIGQLADVLERIRMSLKTAMDRLSKS